MMSSVHLSPNQSSAQATGQGERREAALADFVEDFFGMQEHAPQ
jgi:hypothetical protein